VGITSVQQNNVCFLFRATCSPEIPPICRRSLFSLQSWNPTLAILHIPCRHTHFGASIRSVRRLLSILLLAVFGLPVVSPLFALSTTEAVRLPACCRRDGKHHCTALPADRGNLAPRRMQLSAPAGKCPCCPTAVSVTPSRLLGLPIGDAIFASLISHPSGLAQTESMQRISRDRARQKRGPPVLSSLA
jgi:hypothetical protein